MAVTAVKVSCAFCLILFLFATAGAQHVSLEAGMRITQSCTINPVEYILDAQQSLDSAAVVIEGEDIVIDFAHAVLRSSLPPSRPDLFVGVAIRIQNSRNITIRNAQIHGYRTAILARNVQGLVIEGCTLRFNYRPQLRSTPLRWDPSDHFIVSDKPTPEWLAQGAALYVQSSQGVSIRSNDIRANHCALLLTDCANVSVENNDISFHSAIGIGLSHCHRPIVIGNRIAFTARGFAQSQVRPLPEAVGIAIIAHRSHYVCAANILTHCTIGLLLGAQQKRRQAATSSSWYEAKQSSRTNAEGLSSGHANQVNQGNQVVGNRVSHCTYGILTQPGNQARISGNYFLSNRTAIALVAGEAYRLEQNVFSQNHLSVQAVSPAQMRGKSGSRREPARHSFSVVCLNRFYDTNVYSQTAAFSLRIDSNFYAAGTIHAMPDLFKSILSGSEPEKDFALLSQPLLAPWQGDQPWPEATETDGKEIIVHEWGPYDYQSPLFLLDSIGINDRWFFRIEGPPGKWRLRSAAGLQMMRFGGSVPDTVSAIPTAVVSDQVLVNCVYLGEKVTDAFGQFHRSEIFRPYPFSFRLSEMLLKWHLQAYAWSALPPNQRRLSTPVRLQTRPLFADSVRVLALSWPGKPAIKPLKEGSVWIANAEAFLQPGTYEFHIAADDRVRLFVDDRLVLDTAFAADPSAPKIMTRSVSISLSGSHRFQIEYFDTTEFLSLVVSLSRK